MEIATQGTTAMSEEFQHEDPLTRMKRIHNRLLGAARVVSQNVQGRLSVLRDHFPSELPGDILPEHPVGQERRAGSPPPPHPARGTAAAIATPHASVGPAPAPPHRAVP